MLDDLLERVWCCLNHIAPDSDKKPPDRCATTNMSHRLPPNFKDKLNATLATGPSYENRSNTMGSDLMPLSVDPKLLDAAFRDLLDRALHESNWNEMLNFIAVYSKQFPDRYSIPLVQQRLEALAITLPEFLKELLNEARLRGCAIIAVSVLSCFRVLLNSSIGRKFVVKSETTLLAIAGALDLQNSKCKILSLEILSGLCLAVDGGHRAVLKSLTEAQEILGERTRFQKLVDDLHREYGTNFDEIATTSQFTQHFSVKTSSRWRETERVRIALMSLINALLKSGPAEHSLEFRLHLRYEFLMLGLQEIIDRLRRNSKQIGTTLEDHFDLFEMMRQEDEQELSSQDSGASSPVDFESPSGMAEALSIRLDNTVALNHLISLLQHLLMIPGDSTHLPLWRLFDLILQQLSMQSAMGSLGSGSDAQINTAGLNPSEVSLRFDMDDLISRLKTQMDYEKLEKELLDTQTELQSERKRSLELENRLSDIQDGLSIASFSRHSELNALPADPFHNSQSSTDANNNNSHLPPIRPPTTLAPPPPPPTALQLKGMPVPGLPAVKKLIPKPAASLKTLNWTTIPVHKLKGTVWEKMEEEKLYKQVFWVDKNSYDFRLTCRNWH